jgi:hypothetical protein
MRISRHDIKGGTSLQHNSPSCSQTHRPKLADGKLGQGWDLETNATGSMDVLYRSARLVLILLEDIQLSNEYEDEHNLIRRLQVKDYYCSVDTEAQALARAFSKVLSACTTNRQEF